MRLRSTKSTPDSRLLATLRVDVDGIGTTSQITQFAGVVLLPGGEHANLRQIEFLPLAEDRILAILVTEDGRVQNRVLFVDRKYTPVELFEAANFFNKPLFWPRLNEVRRRLVQDMEHDSISMNRIMRTAVKWPRNFSAMRPRRTA
ncbi:MAG: hypothetical protein Ct9H300mP14_13560 [Gammaproteobacteria bacterium]|nr:MAG: hypothetical protein Ct9H300mP14_13560 [Gammaproteobacteria bacterium]